MQKSFENTVQKRKNACNQHFLLFSPAMFSILKTEFIIVIATLNLLSSNALKVAHQILGRKFYKNTKKSSLYSQSLLNFIHKTLVVKRHLITREEIKDLLWSRSTPMGNTVYFYMSSMFIGTLKIHRRSFKHSIR